MYKSVDNSKEAKKLEKKFYKVHRKGVSKFLIPFIG
jgi:hypothetical protein